MTRPLSCLALLCACLASFAGCGGGGDQKTEAPKARGGPARNVDPVPEESVSNVIDRVRGAATASECVAVKGLLHSTYGEVSDAACEAVKAQIDGFQNPRGAAYKTGAAVYYRTATGKRRLIALAMDADRTYRIAFIRDVPDKVAGGGPQSFNRNAQAVVRAMRDGDCDAYLPLVSRRDGLGVGNDEQVCRRASDLPYRRELIGNTAARPIPLGGDGQVAFFKLRTRPDAYYTMIMARQEPRAGGRPRYVLVTVLPAD